MQLGMPGKNWDDAITWQGRPALMVQRSYQEWVGLLEGRDEFSTVMQQYGDSLHVPQGEADKAASLGLQAFALAIAEVRDENIVPELAKITEVAPDVAHRLWFSRLDCDESPFKGCAFQSEPAFGDACVFCGARWR